MKPELYWKGDKIECTGSTTIKHGGLFHEAILLEGINLGKKIWVSHEYLDERGFFLDAPEVVGAK